MTGLHVISRPSPRGTRWYVYAWRGGPCVHKVIGNKPVITPEILSTALSAQQSRSGTSGTFEDIISAYRASPEFERLRDATKRDYRLWLNRVSARFGTAGIGAFEDRRMRGIIIAWRDQWRSQPRTADKASVMMGTLLAWAVQRAMVSINVAAGIPQLHRVDKSDEVWERRHIRAMVNAPKHLREALLLAALTGLRLGDLVRLDWAQVGSHAIIVDKTRKRGGRAVIPITPTLRRFLDKLKNREGIVLRNSRGAAWTESGLGSVFHKSRPVGFDRTMHDLRGTFVTFLAMCGLTDEEIARIVGWTARRVGGVRARYVDEVRVVISMAERLSA